MTEVAMALDFNIWIWESSWREHGSKNNHPILSFEESQCEVDGFSDAVLLGLLPRRDAVQQHARSVIR